MYVIVPRNGICVYIYTHETHTHANMQGHRDEKRKGLEKYPGRNTNASCICGSREGKVREGKGEKKGGGCDLGVRLKEGAAQKEGGWDSWLMRLLLLETRIIIIITIINLQEWGGKERSPYLNFGMV